MAARIQRLLQINDCTNTKTIATQIQSLLQKKAVQIQRLLQQMAAQMQRLPKVNSGRFFTHFLNLMYGDGVAAFTFMIHV